MKKMYAGLDVSDEMTAVCVIDQNGKVLLEASAKTTPTDINDVLKRYKRSLKSVGLESSDTAIWLNRELKRARYPMVFLSAVHAHGALRARINKTDTNDARGLAELVARGIYTVAHVKSDASLRIRTMLGLRASILAKARELDQAMKMSQRLWGGKQGSSIRTTRKTSGTSEDIALQTVRQSTARLIDAMYAEARDLRNLIDELARANDVCRRLMTIPGVGPITALAFVAAVDDPSRFKSSRTVAAYFGLTPRVYQSGLLLRSGRISRRGDASIRTHLYVAAQVMVSLSHSQCRLRLWAKKIAEKKGNRFAYVACSRKLAVLMHHLWISGEEFDATR